MNWFSYLVDIYVNHSSGKNTKYIDLSKSTATVAIAIDKITQV